MQYNHGYVRVAVLRKVDEDGLDHYGVQLEHRWGDGQDREHKPLAGFLPRDIPVLIHLLKRAYLDIEALEAMPR
jgi:hypothetical protein